ncbi:MAG TPA: M28 family metallopeptidase [Terriglobales bacterium]|nr:M28 family metallopeptidase [Terriglobales bacterium]
MSLLKRKPSRIAGVMAVLLCPVAWSATQPSNVPAGQVDPQIAAALKDISAAQIQKNIETLVGFYTRQTLSSDVPGVGEKGINAAAEWIRNEFQNYSSQCGDCLEVKTDQFQQPPGPRIPQATTITNVYAVLRGTNAENAGRMYVVTGHYDSRNSDPLDAKGEAPGANDDASGTAVSLECARVLSKHRFPATIIFLTVAGEEQGLFGSAHFAKLAKSVGWDIDAVLNNDIVGGDRTPGDAQRDPHIVRVFSEGLSSTADEAELHRVRSLGGESDSPSRQLARYVQDVAKEYLSGADFQAMLIFRHDRYLRGGDHSSFNDQGYSAVRLTEFRENFNHQHQNVRTEIGIEYGDLPKFVDYEYIANVARLNAATLATLASAPAPPVDVRLLTKALTNDSTLEWKASRGGLATGYEVLWRDTTAPDWEHFKDIGSVTQTTLPVSKDNVIFAVRAVDGKGHSSLPVVPQPER